jgi:hypothetical protein
VSLDPDQQPIQRTVGRRQSRSGRPLTPEDRAALASLARYLAEQRVEYALVGGYALAAHGFNRFTEDIDILVNPSAENSRRWMPR